MNAKRMAGMLLAAGWLGAVQADRYVVEPGTPGGTDTPPFNTWTNAATNIQLAVNAAADGEVVLVSNGTYGATGSGTAFVGINALYIDKNVRVQSVNGPAFTILDGGYPVYTNRLVCLNKTGAVFSGFTVMRGCAGRGGGALIGSFGGAITNCVIISNITDRALGTDGGGGLATYTTTSYTGYVDNCTIRANVAISNNGGGGWFRSRAVIQNCDFVDNVCSQGVGRGGGVYVDGAIWLIGCLISNNAAQASYGGGGVYGDNGLYMTNCALVDNRANVGAGVELVTSGYFYDCLFAGNIAGNLGGGAYCSSSSARMFLLDQCRVYSNRAVNSGGGIYVGACRTGVVVNCAVISNSANNGGGVYIGTGICGLTNVTIQSNLARNGSGGGLAVAAGGIVELRNALIAGNLSTNGSTGGVLLRTNCVMENCTVAANTALTDGGGIYCIAGGLARNAIIYGNTSGGSASNWFNSGAGMSYANTCTMPTNGLDGAGNLEADPLMAAPASADYRLQTGSPCIDAGVNQPWMADALDLDGRRRLDPVVRRADMGCYEHLPAVSIFRAR